MNIKTVLLINSIIALLFGIGFITMPVLFCNMLDFATNGDGPLAMRFAGILVFGLSILTFGARKVKELFSLKIIILYLAVLYSMMLIYHLIFQLFFQMGNAMLWSVDILHLIYAIYYWIFLLKVKELE